MFNFTSGTLCCFYSNLISYYECSLLVLLSLARTITAHGILTSAGVLHQFNLYLIPMAINFDPCLFLMSLQTNDFLHLVKENYENNLCDTSSQLLITITTVVYCIH